jgi:hypothetical protein
MYWLDLNQKKFSMWKNPLQIFVDSNEDWTSKMAGNIQGRIQNLRLGVVSRRGFWGPLIPQWVQGRALGVWGITYIYLNDNSEPTTSFLSDQKNRLWVLILSDNC